MNNGPLSSHFSNARALREYMINKLTNNGEFCWQEQHDIPTERSLAGAIYRHGEFEPMPEELYDGTDWSGMPADIPRHGWIIGNGDLYAYSGDNHLASYFRFVRKS